MNIAAEKRTRVNEEINTPQVRVIGADGSQLGVLGIQEALRIAEQAELDLVEIAAQADPPVCRVMDYGKFLFEQNKKRHAAKKKQKQIQVKEVKFRPTTEEGDYQVKLRSLIRFLGEGDKAKITLRYRGRELVHQELGVNLLKRLETDLAEYGTVEQFPRMEGRQLVMVLAPKRGAASATPVVGKAEVKGDVAKATG